MTVHQIGLSAMAGLGLAACIGSAPPAATTAAFVTSAPFACRVEAAARAGQTEVRASVSAQAPVSGLYRLDLAQVGPGGSSTITQSGPFSVAAGETLTLGRASFGARPAALRARLTVTWAGGEVRCPVTAPMVPL